MTYTARMLITQSLYLSGKVSRTFEVPTNDQISDGFNLLNAVLAIKTANNRLIPYYEYANLTLVVGQEKYFIPNLIEIAVTNFYINSVRYPTQEINRTKYFGAPRVDTVQTLPSGWHTERTFGGSDLYVYPLPASTYTYNYVGKFFLTAVSTLDTDLSLTLEPFYIEYLRYALAEYICSESNLVFQPQSYQKLSEYEAIIADISPIDFTMKISSTFSRESGMQWAFVNLYNGWLPS